jgi:hypothetical protein
MEARCEPTRSDILLVAGVIWGAGLLLTIAALLVYIAVKSYDPALSCDELSANAFTPGALPDNDARDDWELLCGYD